MIAVDCSRRSERRLAGPLACGEATFRIVGHEFSRKQLPEVSMSNIDPAAAERKTVDDPPAPAQLFVLIGGALRPIADATQNSFV
jgi:hypothetical protein